MKKLISLFCLIAFFTCVYGQDKERKTEIQVTTNYEFLTKNLGTWRSMTINFRHDFSKRQVVYGFYQKAYRSNVNNDTATIGLYQPLNKKLTLLLETSVSPEHKFLPKWSGLAQLETRITPTTFLNTGYRRTIYRDAKVNVFNVGVEKYWKAYRFVPTVSVANGKNFGVPVIGRFQVDRYYGKRSNTVSAEVSAGSEVTSIFGDGKVLKTNIAAVSVGGKHWLTDNFGFSYRVGFHRQGSFYSRGGMTIGAIFRF